MSTYFVDTSGLVKRYVNETGTSWVKSWILPEAGNSIVVSQLASVELFSVLARKQRANQLPARLASVLQIAVLNHLAFEFVQIEIDINLLALSRRLVSRHYLRTLDAIHLASALKAQQLTGATLIFISSDRRLLSAAAAEGFATDDPNNHA